MTSDASDDEEQLFDSLHGLTSYAQKNDEANRPGKFKLAILGLAASKVHMTPHDSVQKQKLVFCETG